MTSRANKDVAAGMLFVAFGALGLMVSKDYPVGTAVRMGSGYVPNGLCWLMVILGGIVGIKGYVAGGEPLERWAWRPLAIITASILAFAFLIERSGLVIATLAIVMMSATASTEFRWKEIAIVAIVLAVGSVLIFAKGLGLALAIWPRFMS